MKGRRGTLHSAYLVATERPGNLLEYDILTPAMRQPSSRYMKRRRVIEVAAKSDDDFNVLIELHQKA